LALNATIYKVHLELSDIDNSKYGTYPLTIALHPSETEERMLLRIVAFAINATENLQFTKGICADDEPDLWEKNLTGDIDHWIELGLLDEKRIKKACNRSKKVSLYTYGSGNVDTWWKHTENKLPKNCDLSVYRFICNSETPFEDLIARTFTLQCAIQEAAIMLFSGDNSIELSVEQLA